MLINIKLDGKIKSDYNTNNSFVIEADFLDRIIDIKNKINFSYNDLNTNKFDLYYKDKLLAEDSIITQINYNINDKSDYIFAKKRSNSCCIIF